MVFIREERQISDVYGDPGFAEESFVSTLDLTVNRVNQAKVLYPLLRGDGMVISVKENLFDRNDLDIRGRTLVSGMESNTMSLHATDMATIIGGAGNRSDKGKGVLPAVLLSSSSFNNLFADEISSLSTLGVIIQNHSYGLVNPDNHYSQEAMSYDIQMHQNPELTHVMSAGNLGETTSTDGKYAGVEGYANISGSFKMAKNPILVGAINEMGEVDPRNSRGPAHDGRIKPELVAYGKDGTSDAAALVSGVSGMLQVAAMTWNSSFLSSSMIKALLIAGSDDVGEVGPDFITGYGSVNAVRSTEILEQGDWINDIILPGESLNYPLNVPPGIAKLQIALTWTDPSGQEGAEKALINDLDLSLLDPAINTIRPWVLNHYPNRDSLLKSAVQGIDTLNNSEFITINNPVAGNYSLSLDASDVAGSQSFSIAYALIPAIDFKWTFPLEGDAFEAGLSQIIRWESNTGNEIDKIEYQKDGGVWETITTNVQGNSGLFHWELPNLSGSYKLRATVNSTDYESGTFRINRGTPLLVEYNCPGEALISWPQNQGVSSYKVFRMGGQYLEEVAQVSDTFFTISSSGGNSDFYRVFPDYNGQTGYASPGLDYTRQGVNCYYKLARAVNYQNDLIRSEVTLSTTRSISSIKIERSRDGNEYSNLVDLPVFEEVLLYTYDDQEPLDEFSYYRFTIILESGEEIPAGESFVYIPFPDTFFVYPNPLDPGGFFTLLTQPDGQTLRMINSMGHLIKTWKVNSESSEFDLPFVEAGVYHLYLENQNGKVLRTKILIR